MTIDKQPASMTATEAYAEIRRVANALANVTMTETKYSSIGVPALVFCAVTAARCHGITKEYLTDLFTAIIGDQYDGPPNGASRIQ